MIYTSRIIRSIGDHLHLPSRICLVLLLGISCHLSMVGQEALFKSREVIESYTSDLKDNFERYQVVDLDINGLNDLMRSNDKSDQQMKAIHLQIGEYDWIFDMLPTDLRTSDYQLLTIENNQVISLPKEANKTFSGFLKGTSHEIRLTLTKGFLSGVVYMADHQVYFEPLSRFVPGSISSKMVVYKSSDVVDRTVQCGWNEALDKTEELNQKIVNQKANTCRIVRIGIASDAGVYADIGSIAGVNNFTTSVINNIAPLYRHTFSDNIEFVIAAQFVSQSSSDDPLTPNTSSGAGTILLNNFGAWMNAVSPGFGTTNIDVGQLYVNRSGFTGGIASLPGICQSLNQRVQAIRYTSGTNNSTAQYSCLAAHETGHNFAATHQDFGIANIMGASCGPLVWHPNSFVQINNHLIGTCLATCTQSPIAQIAGSTGGCTDTQLTFIDQSQYGATRMWNSPGSSPSTGTSAMHTTSYSTAGIFNVNLTSTNTTGSNSSSQSVVIADDITDICVPSGPQGAGGIFAFGLANVLNTSNAGNNLNNRLEDFSCSQVINLERSTTYTISSLDLGFPQQFQAYRIYIDYNGDNDFTDPGEQVATSGFTSFIGDVALFQPISFTTPSSPVENQLVRMRIWVDNTLSDNPCQSPAYGQMEDYSVLFISPPSSDPCNTTTVVNQSDISANALFHDGHIISGALPPNNVNIDANNVIFRAENSVELSPVFEVSRSNVFTVEIGPCE